MQTLWVQASNHAKMPCQVPRGGEGQWRPVGTARRAIPCITFRKRVLCNMCNTMLCLSNNLNIDHNIHKHLTTHHTINLLTCDILDMLPAHGGDFQSRANGNSIRTNGRIDKESNISNGIRIAIPISTDKRDGEEARLPALISCTMSGASVGQWFGARLTAYQGHC